MTQASGQRKAAQNQKQHADVTALFAAASAHKMMWANAPIGTKESGYRMDAALAAENAIIAAPFATRAELLMQLALLQDWIEPDITQSAKALLQAIIAKVECWPQAPANTGAARAPRRATAGASRRQRKAPPATRRTAQQIRSSNADLGEYGAPPGAAAPPTPRASPDPEPAKSSPPKVAIDRRARPCVVDGKLFPSIVAAAVALQTTADQVRKMAAKAM